MENKILIVGQAPPSVKQSLPYDTTMLYDWFNEIGVDKSRALEIFSFDAVYDEFPGFNKNGGHLKPMNFQMEDYWERELKNKIENAQSVLCLGSCARDFLKTKSFNKPISYIIHPSKRNYSLYKKNKSIILNEIKNLITKDRK